MLNLHQHYKECITPLNDLRYPKTCLHHLEDYLSLGSAKLNILLFCGRLRIETLPQCLHLFFTPSAKGCGSTNKVPPWKTATKPKNQHNQLLKIGNVQNKTKIYYHTVLQMRQKGTTPIKRIKENFKPIINQGALTILILM